MFMKPIELTVLLRYATLDGAEKAFVSAGITKHSYSKTKADRLVGTAMLLASSVKAALQINNKKIGRNMPEALVAQEPGRLSAQVDR